VDCESRLVFPKQTEAPGSSRNVREKRHRCKLEDCVKVETGLMNGWECLRGLGIVDRAIAF
jgi:hypothetical protein